MRRYVLLIFGGLAVAVLTGASPIADLLARVETLEADSQTLAGQVTSLEAENLTLGGQVTTLETESGALRQQVAALENHRTRRRHAPFAAPSSRSSELSKTFKIIRLDTASAHETVPFDIRTLSH